MLHNNVLHGNTASHLYHPPKFNLFANLRQIGRPKTLLDCASQHNTRWDMKRWKTQHYQALFDIGHHLRALYRVYS